MATITSRSMPLIPLPLNINTLISTGCAGSIIPPDNCIVANHITSPKILHQSNTLSPINDDSRYGTGSEHQSYTSDMESRKNCIIDDLSDARSSCDSSYRDDSFHQPEYDDDQISRCSDDSELSVGKEVENEQEPPRHIIRKKRRRDDDSYSAQYSPTAMSEQTDMCASEDVSNESMQTPKDIDLIPSFPIIRPNPTRLQEEFLRNSQLYAEELMKHQMNIMVAARSVNLSPKNTDFTFGFPVRPSDVLNHGGAEDEKCGFRPHMRSLLLTREDRNSHSPEGITFRGIHSHLNAISKITSALGRDLSNLSSNGIITSRENSQSPPNNLLVQQILNNNLNDRNLKFSIDNILKPNFGCRITDPLLKRSKSARKHNRLSTTNGSIVPEKTQNGSPIDLTSATTVPNIQSPSMNSQSPHHSPSDDQDKSSTPTNLLSPKSSSSNGPMVWPAWVYCTRYSDRPSSGPRTRRPKKPPSEKGNVTDDKRPRTAFSGPQLARLKHEFAENRYLTERRRQQLSAELGLNEAQIKIWFQNKRAKIKKSSGQKNPLALQLMAQGLYNHSTVPLTREEEELQELQEAKAQSSA